MEKTIMTLTVMLLWGSLQAMAQNQGMAQAISFGDYSSQTIAAKAWDALGQKDLNSVEIYVKKNLELYGAKAQEMQASLKEYAEGSNEKIFSYWALNDIGTSLFILGKAYEDAGRKEDARKAYKQVIDEYSYAQCWDTKGWFWKPAEAAQKNLDEMNG